MLSREAQLEFCKICKNQRFDFNQGLICGLTDKPANFEDECETFEEDPVMKVSVLRSQETRVVYQDSVSKGTRFTNYILDFFFRLAFTLAIGIVIAIIAPSWLIVFEESNKLLEYIIGFVVGIAYYITLETLTGRSMAKLITRTKVVMENGEKANFEAILIRSLCRFIPFNPLSFLGESSRGWHDTLSKTKVISVKDQ